MQFPLSLILKVTVTSSITCKSCWAISGLNSRTPQRNAYRTSCVYLIKNTITNILVRIMCLLCDVLLFPKRQILDSTKLKEIADDNFKFVDNARKPYKEVENTMGKGEIARYEQFLILPQYFQEICTAYT